MNIIEHARPMPRGLIGAVRAEADPAAVLAELNRGLTAFMNDYGNRLNAVEKDIDRLTLRSAGAVASLGDGNPSGRQRRPDSPAMAEYRETFTRYFKHGESSISGGLGALRDLEVKATMTVGSNPDGGYSVLPEIDEAVERLVSPVSPMRQICSVVQTTSPEYKLLKNVSRNATAWVGEVSERDASQNAVFVELKFPAMEVYSMPAASQSLLDDSFIDIGAWLAGAVADDFAMQEGLAFVQGNGVMKPRGVIGGYDLSDEDDWATDGSGDRLRPWNQIQYVPAGASDPTDDQLVAALTSMSQKLAIKYRAGASWSFSREFANRVRGIKDSQGRLLWSDNGRLVSGLPETLLGYPVNFDDGFPSDGANSITAAIANWKRAYLIVDRVGIRILRDPFTQKPLVLFYTTKRVGGGVQNFEALKLLKFASS